MNKMRERGLKATAATLACVQQCHVDASNKTFHKCQIKTCGNTTLATPVGRTARAKALTHYSSKSFYCAPRYVNLFIYTASRGAYLSAMWLSAHAHGIKSLI